MAHHALMFSTPAGGLIWRINQVISRDAGFVLRNCRERGIEFDGLHSPRECFGSPEWQKEFLEGAINHEDSLRRGYCLTVFTAMERLVQFRTILMGKGVRRKHADLTVGEFLELVNFVYDYLQDRCDCAFATKWKTRRSHEEKLFPEGEQYNINDIAECHAISAELFVLRALGDSKAFKNRLQRALNGPYGEAFATAVDIGATGDQYGFSPYYVQAAALASLCGSVDTIDPDALKERYIEDEFPWHRFGTWKLQNGAAITSSVLNLLEWSQRPLFGQESNWLRFADWTDMTSIEGVQDFFSSLASLGLDLQVYTMHQGAILNFRFLATTLVESRPSKDPIPFEKLSRDSWIAETNLSIPMIEYDNGILFSGFNLDEIYKQDHPARSMRAFASMRSPVFQLMAHIVNGTSARNQFAEFYERQVPSIDILRGKISEHFKKPEVAESVCDMLKNVYERGLKATLLVTQRRYV